MRPLLRLALLVAVVIVSGSFGASEAMSAVPVPRGTAPIYQTDLVDPGWPPCVATHEGATWIDRYGNMWECRFVFDPYVGYIYTWRKVKCTIGPASVQDPAPPNHRRWN